MKKLLFIFGQLVILITACAQQVAPIQSMYDIQPYLEKKLGTPSISETAYKGTRGASVYTTLYLTYENRPDLSYEKIAAILSKGFGETIYPLYKTTPINSGGLIPLYNTKYGTVYKVQFGMIKEDPLSFTICILDDKDEIPIPTK